MAKSKRCRRARKRPVITILWKFNDCESPCEFPFSGRRRESPRERAGIPAQDWPPQPRSCPPASAVTMRPPSPPTSRRPTHTRQRRRCLASINLISARVIIADIINILHIDVILLMSLYLATRARARIHTYTYLLLISTIHQYPSNRMKSLSLSLSLPLFLFLYSYFKD